MTITVEVWDSIEIQKQNLVTTENCRNDREREEWRHFSKTHQTLYFIGSQFQKDIARRVVVSEIILFYDCFFFFLHLLWTEQHKLTLKKTFEFYLIFEHNIRLFLCGQVFIAVNKFCSWSRKKRSSRLFLFSTRKKNVFKIAINSSCKCLQLLPPYCFADSFSSLPVSLSYVCCCRDSLFLIISQQSWIKHVWLLTTYPSS